MLRDQNKKLEEKVDLKDAKITKLEEKIEAKDAELIQLRVQLGATNILQNQLKDKEDEIKKLNTELHEAKKGSPINPHKHCEVLEFEL